MGVGMLRSATDLFAQLELWEEAVTCLKVTDDVEKAREMAEERIAIRPESGLLCLLSEMTQDPSHALRAWELSGGKYARAQRTLARMAFNRGDKDACISHFQLSLALNPLFEDAWFTMVPPLVLFAGFGCWVMLLVLCRAVVWCRKKCWKRLRKLSAALFSWIKYDRSHC
jgi:tetratricopeptide (TPR) repeat protein